MMAGTVEDGTSVMLSSVKSLHRCQRSPNMIAILTLQFIVQTVTTLVGARSGKYISLLDLACLLHCMGNQLAPWCEPASELYRPSARRLSAMLVPTFADRKCDVVSKTDSYSRILGFLDCSRYFFFQVAPQLYSRG
jgi:hypothetical protein